MLIKFVRDFMLILGLLEGGCDICIGYRETIPEQLSGSLLYTGQNEEVGYFTGDSGLQFDVARSKISLVPGQLQYSLEVYDSQNPCPPDPTTRLSLIGTATDAGLAADPNNALFSFPYQGSIRSLEGKMLILRAAPEFQSSAISVLCTRSVEITAAMMEFIPASG